METQDGLGLSSQAPHQSLAPCTPAIPCAASLDLSNLQASANIPWVSLHPTSSLGDAGRKPGAEPWDQTTAPAWVHRQVEGRGKHPFPCLGCSPSCSLHRVPHSAVSMVLLPYPISYEQMSAQANGNQRQEQTHGWWPGKREEQISGADREQNRET